MKIYAVTSILLSIMGKPWDYSIRTKLKLPAKIVAPRSKSQSNDLNETAIAALSAMHFLGLACSVEIPIESREKIMITLADLFWTTNNSF